MLVIITLSTLIVRELLIDRESRSFYNELAETVERRRTGGHGSGGSHSGGNRPGRPSEPGEPVDENAFVPYVNFELLNEIFPGIVAWIKLDGTPIDYPVMQTTDNEFFLDHLIDGTPHRSGSIFLDYRNRSNFLDRSILIYGHETRPGDMFGVLKQYRRAGFIDDHPIIHLYTPEKDYIIEVFAGHIAHSVHDHPPLRFENDAEFLSYIERLRRVSVFNTGVEIRSSDRIVSLVTCTYDFDDARLIIVGVLKEP